MAHATAPSPASTPWGRGDYHRFALATIWQLGPVLVDACAVGPGDRVLDVAAGSGNVAIRAAAAGARVTAADVAVESMRAGRREAARHGVEVAWVRADARALPFPDGAFDVVTSLFGAMFAPDHRAVAREILRVCRPGGRIGLMSFVPGGLAGELFGILAPHLPPPTIATPPPTRWGEEDHLRDLLGPAVDELSVERRDYVERAPDGPEGYHALLRDAFGPVVAVREELDPWRRARLDARLRRFARERIAPWPGGPPGYRYTYLLARARRAARWDPRRSGGGAPP